MTFLRLIVSLNRPAGAENTNLAMLQALLSNPIWVNVAPRFSAYSGIMGPTIPNPSIATKIDTSSACNARSMTP